MKIKKITIPLLVFAILFTANNVVYAEWNPENDIIDGHYIKTFIMKNVPKKNGKGKVSIKAERGAGYGMRVLLECYKNEVLIKKNKKSLECEKWVNLPRKNNKLDFSYENLTNRELTIYAFLSVYNEGEGVDEQLYRVITIPAKK